MSWLILYFPQLSVENFNGQIQMINRIPKREPATRIPRENKDEEEDLAAIGRSTPLFLRPQRVYPAYFVQWQWKTSYSGGILKLSMRQWQFVGPDILVRTNIFLHQAKLSGTYLTCTEEAVPVELLADPLWHQVNPPGYHPALLGIYWGTIGKYIGNIGEISSSMRETKSILTFPVQQPPPSPPEIFSPSHLSQEGQLPSLLRLSPD